MYRKRQPEPLPFQRNIRVRLDVGHLLIATTPLMVTVHHFKSPKAEADYTIRFDVSGNPELLELFDPVNGWDFVGLISFLGRKMGVLRTFDLRDPALREQAGLRTVSVPSQKPQRQEKRPAEQALQLISDYVRDNPNCTRLEIASGINRKKSPHTIAQIEWLVHTGVLARTHVVRPEGTIEWRYIFLGDNEN